MNEPITYLDAYYFARYLQKERHITDRAVPLYLEAIDDICARGENEPMFASEQDAYAAWLAWRETALFRARAECAKRASDVKRLEASHSET